MRYGQKILPVHWLLVLFLASAALGQQFGRNKVQYENKNWQYIQSEHFDFYYYEGGMRLAEFAAHVAESSYVSLNRVFNYKLIDRIPLIIYRSHNDFTETNTSSAVVDESVGGFTEFLKNRVVIPFDGSYEQFRHVIHHELTHAVMLQFLYGAGPGSIIKGVSRSAPPIWFIEGLAEFTSLGWDAESDMYVRDATQRGYLPPIPYLQAFLAYKGGQAVLVYLEETYGNQKLGELLQRTRTSRNFERAWESAVGEKLDESNKKWQRYMRQRYWPDVQDRKEPADYAQPLTDHVGWQNFVNNSPAVSPNGDQVAFLTDRNGYFDIYVVSAMDKKKVTKLISGQRKADLEELQWLRPGMSWSNDGNYLVFSSRSGGEDALNILDVKKKKIVDTFKFRMDGVFSPAWSPVSNEIAFIGVKQFHSDLYVFDKDAKKLRQITHDIYTDQDPAWSPDGRMIAFVSDRKDKINQAELSLENRIEHHDYHTDDIYLINADGSNLRRLTEAPTNETSPLWMQDADQLLYISDESGIANIYSHNLATGEKRALTNLLTGCAQLAAGYKSDRLVFTAFANGGYDIFIWPDPFFKIEGRVEPPLTAYAKRRSEGRQYLDLALEKEEADKVTQTVKRGQDFSNYIFGSSFKQGNINLAQNRFKNAMLDSAEFREGSGGFRSNDYRIKFTIDYLGANFGYDPIYGIYGLTQMYLSDVLGNHQIQIGADIAQTLENSDFLLSYQYLKRRMDFSLTGFQFVSYYATTFGTVRFAYRGLALNASYPLSRFQRIDGGLQYFNIAEENLSYNFITSEKIPVLMPMLSYTSDNSIWGYTGPIRGGRSYIGLSASPRVGNQGKEFVTGTFDIRKYFSIKQDYSFAFRLSGGASFGKNPNLFILGGTENWLNYRFYDNIQFSSISDYFLSDLVMPLRGASLYEMVGSRAALFNAEFRFPLIQYLIARFPLPLAFQNIQGIAFLDAGSAWEKDSSWRFTATRPDGSRYVRDIVTGFGYGIRLNVYYFILKFDAAWRTDFNGVSKPLYYYSIGLDF